MLCMMCHWQLGNADPDKIEVCLNKDFTTDMDKFETQGVSYEGPQGLFLNKYLCNGSVNVSDMKYFGKLTGVCDREICSAKFNSSEVNVMWDDLAESATLDDCPGGHGNFTTISQV